MEAASTLCKTLTTLIHRLEPQVGTPASGRAETKNGHAYYDVATLMTRGVEDYDGAGRRVIAVTGASTTDRVSVAAFSNRSHSQPPSSPPLDEGLSQANMVVTQNQKVPHQTFEKVTITASLRSLQNILLNLDTSNKVTLEAHAADVLKVLTSMQGLSSGSKEYINMLGKVIQFVNRRCLPKIKHRIRNAKFLYDDKLFHHLSKWTPAPTEVLRLPRVGSSKVLFPGYNEAFVPIPLFVKPLFESLDLSLSLIDNEWCYQLNIRTAPQFVATLVKAYRDLEKAASSYDENDNDSLLAYLDAMHTLYLWVYNVSDYFVAICRVPSLHERLSSSHSKSPTISPSASDEMNVDKTSDEPSDEPSDDLPDEVLDAVEAMAEFSPVRSESDGDVIIRYLRTIVAWTHAVIRLSRGKLFRSIPDLTLNICHAHVPSGLTKLLSANQLIQKLEPLLQQQPERRGLEKTIRTLCQKRKKFTGAVHSEAIIMGLTTACLSENRDPDVTEELVELLQGSNRVIGVGKKCCWTCHRLGDKLNRQHPEQPFQLPGTSGIVFAWAPPFGIPLSVLDELNEELKIELIKKLEKAANDLDAIQSHQSSPSSSVGEDGQSYDAKAVSFH